MKKETRLGWLVVDDSVKFILADGIMQSLCVTESPGGQSEGISRLV